MNVAIVPTPFAEPLAVLPLPPARVLTVPIVCAEAWGSSTTDTTSSRTRSDNTMLDRFARAMGLGQRRCNTTDRVVVVVVVATDLACSRCMHEIDDVNREATTVSRQTDKSNLALCGPGSSVEDILSKEDGIPIMSSSAGILGGCKLQNHVRCSGHTDEQSRTVL